MLIKGKKVTKLIIFVCILTVKRLKNRFCCIFVHAFYRGEFINACLRNSFDRFEMLQKSLASAFSYALY